MGKNDTDKLVKGALLLTLAGLVSKVLSAGYRIPLQNLTGDLGFYVYQQVYPILGMMLIMSLYGFPSAISKMTVELEAEGKSMSVRSFYFPIFMILLLINCLLFLCLYFSASTITTLIGDRNLIRAYQLVAFSLLLLPFTSLLRGAFQGKYMMKPTAYSQVGEQFVRVFIIIFVAYLFMRNKIDVYEIGEAAALASICGAVFAIIILSVFFIKKKPFTLLAFKIPWLYYIKTILTLGIIASLSHMILLIIQFADVFTLVPNLTTYGLSKIEAMEAKGIFDRGQPLIQLGTVIGSSFALALIPAISKRKLDEQPERFNTYIRSGLLFSFYLSAGAVIGLIMIFPAVNTLLFQNTRGTFSLQILSLAIFLSSISITVSAILQGLDYFKRTAGYILVAFLIKWIGNQVLVPVWGISGSAIATILSLFLLCVVLLVELHKKMPHIQFFQQINLWALVKSSLGMIGYLFMIDYLIPYEAVTSRFGLLLYVLFIAITGAIIYLLLLLKCKAFKDKELKLLPFSSFFIKLHQGRD
jgi:PST family polysaccharide transporter